MTSTQLHQRLREVAFTSPPLPGGGNTAIRHKKLYEIGMEDLSLAKLVEAHWDAIAILAEAGRAPLPNAIYAVWASEMPGQSLRVIWDSNLQMIKGSKSFCSGLGIVDCALVTVSEPAGTLLEVDLRQQPSRLHSDCGSWATEAFRMTNTGNLFFDDYPIDINGVVGSENWYTKRPGFWHGACGPAACWAGGAAGLVKFAQTSRRCDPHTLAHLGAMDAGLWTMRSVLKTAGEEIDQTVGDSLEAQTRALRVRHLIESSCSDVLHRLARAYGPYPIALEAEISLRYQELGLYLRQNHGERDLEGLGRLVHSPGVDSP